MRITDALGRLARFAIRESADEDYLKKEPQTAEQRGFEE